MVIPEKLWLYWIIAGFILMIIEIFTPGFVTFLIGLACLITAIFAWLKVPFYYQLIVFSIITIILTFWVRPYLIKFFFRNHKEDETNVHGLIGKIGIVTEDIDNDLSLGRVKIGGEVWRSVSIDNQKFLVGQKVAIKNIEGNKVVVDLAV